VSNCTTRSHCRWLFIKVTETLLDWIDDVEFVIGDTQFRLAPLGGVPSSARRLLLVKTRFMVEAYAELVNEMKPKQIFELGIYQGGSTAFLAQIARPEKLVAVDREESPVAVLEQYLERQGLHRTVRTFYGVDQADHERLTEIVRSEYQGRALDLVVDDASHLLAETRRSFNTLFPYLRPGGVYAIEDWSWAHVTDSYVVWPDRTPLTVLILELVLACASRPEVVDELTIKPGLVRVRRGKHEIDPASFDLSSCYDERARRLVEDL
jgi:hypothetical protein